VNVSTLLEMLEHGADGKKLFVMAGQYIPEERKFLEESTLAGYDRMAAFRAAHPDASVNHEKWRRELYEECLASSRHRSQGNELTPAIKGWPVMGR
jgi:hypothetical protein